MDKFISLNVFTQGLLLGFILGRLSFDFFPKKPKIDDDDESAGMFCYRHKNKQPHHF
jgi:hypothetical protein